MKAHQGYSDHIADVFRARTLYMHTRHPELVYYNLQRFMREHEGMTFANNEQHFTFDIPAHVVTRHLL